MNVHVYTPSDLKIMTHYKNHTLKFPIYTSFETQQIYDCNKQVKTCDSRGRVIVEVIDERNKYSGFRYAQLNRSALLKANNDFDKERESEAPRYRFFDSNHQPMKE